MTATTVCDHPGCEVEIDQTLETVCGLTLKRDQFSCDKFFCAPHRANEIETPERYAIGVCDDCLSFLTLDCHERIEGHKHFGIEGRT